VSDTSAPDEPSTAQDVRGVPVAADLVPPIEQPAYRRPAPLWQSVPVALVVLALLAAIGFGVAWVNDRWGDAAQVATAADAFKALVSGDADGFLALVDPQVASGLTRSELLANAKTGRYLKWAGPFFEDGLARVTVRSGPAAADIGTATFTPDPDRSDLVRVSASGGPLGEATGTIQLVRELAGWRLVGFEFRESAVPTATPPAK
jgi:hypothetical protein